MRKKSFYFKLLAFCFMSAIAIYFIIGFIFFHFALDANALQSRNIGEKAYVPSEEIKPTIEQQEREKDTRFLKETKAMQRTIISEDGLKLKATVYEQNEQTNEWIFAVHGYTGSARQMTRWNRQFYEIGYNVFAPDLRGHGLSEGDYYGMGWIDQKDLLMWISKLIKEHPDAKITLYGVSMGASAVLNVASHKLPPNIDTVIADSGFTSVAEIFETQLKNTLHLPKFPIMHSANTVANIRIDLDFYEASTITLVPKIDLPIFYFHGEDDKFVPVSNVKKLSSATTAPHDVWIVEGANHAEAVKISPEQYKEKTNRFIQKYRMK